MVRNARFSWNDEDCFESPDRSNGLDDLDDFDFDGFETTRRRRKARAESRGTVESPESQAQGRN